MSQETKWTPGPWELRKGHKRHIVVQAHKYIEAGIYVAEVSLEAWRPEERKETALHDACLITSSPALYGALEQIQALQFTDEPMTVAMAVWIEKAQHIARAALAKARGEQA